MESMNVQKRDLTVKAKKLRRLGMVPGSVFGKALPETIAIQMDAGTARKLFMQKREGSKLLLNIDGEEMLVQVKEKTMDTLSNEILDISFQTLTSDEKVNSVIHIILTNEEVFGGLLEKMTMEIPYASLPGDMIDTITVDAKNLKTGDVLTVKDVPQLMSDKLELQIKENEMILRINEKRTDTHVRNEE